MPDNSSAPRTCCFLGQTGNPSEMPASLFSTPTDTTIEASGSNSELVKTTGHERLKITDTCSSD
jgi:hypothetical protein